MLSKDQISGPREPENNGLRGWGTGGGEGCGDESVHPLAVPDEPETTDEGAGEDGLPETVPPDGGAGVIPGVEVDQETPADTGNSRSGRKQGSGKISNEAFRKAVAAADGNIAIIARAIGRDPKSVRDRIENDPELDVLYGALVRVKEKQPPKKTLPTKTDAMKRSQKDIPVVPEMEVGIELAEQVAEMDREAYRAALKEYGVSERQLNKLKALDGLAKNGGRLLSVSLQMTHQNYLGQLHMLSDVATELKDRIKGEEMEDGTIQPLDAEEHVSLVRALNECVKEARMGYGVMMAGTEAMVRMMAAARAGDKGAQPKATSGWGPMKKVREG